MKFGIKVEPEKDCWFQEKKSTRSLYFQYYSIWVTKYVNTDLFALKRAQGVCCQIWV